MAIWKDQSTPAKPTPEPARFDAPSISDIHPTASAAGIAPAPAATPAPARAAEPQGKESLIASDISIEGKIEGAGNVRIAGRFTGDVNVKGNLTIESGAKLNGGVRANKVIIAGELEGNIESAQRVEVLESGVLVGDVKAGTLTVAAGSRMRGLVEFGWDDKASPKGSTAKTENGAGS